MPLLACTMHTQVVPGIRKHVKMLTPKVLVRLKGPTESYVELAGLRATPLGALHGIERNKTPVVFVAGSFFAIDRSCGMYLLRSTTLSGNIRTVCFNNQCKAVSYIIGRSSMRSTGMMQLSTVKDSVHQVLDPIVVVVVL